MTRKSLPDRDKILTSSTGLHDNAPGRLPQIGGVPLTKEAPMTARHLLILPLAALVFTAFAEQLSAQSPHDLFQRALRLERVEGDLSGANALFREVAEAGDRTLAAQALLRIGENAERMGRAEALDVYERLVRDFADQTAAAEAARVRLAALRAERAESTASRRTPPPPSSDLTVRLVWAGSELDGLDVEGRPTPDGRYLTFVDWRSGDLAVRDLTAGSSRRITSRGYPEYALFSSVSRDGSRVAYLWALPPWRPQLRVIGMDGSGERVLLDNANGEIGYLQPHEWTADGRRIFVTFYMTDGTAALGMVDVESGHLDVVKSLGWRRPMHASLSPDGRYIVYDLPVGDSPPRTRDIFLLAADGSFEIPLVESRASDLHPMWAPDGGHVLFSSDRGGSIDLWAIRVVDGRPGGEPVMVKRDMARNFFYPMGFTRDGTYFYAKDTGGGDIYLAPFDPASGRVTGRARRIVDRDVGYNTAPHLSPDGRRLVYATRSVALSLGHTAFLVVTDLETGERGEPIRSLVVGRKAVRPRWSPDGAAILVDGSTEAHGRGLYLVDPTSRRATPVTLDPPGAPSEVGQGEWMPDGRSIVYARVRHEGPEAGTWLIHRPLTADGHADHGGDAGDAERPLRRLPSHTAWTLSPDGRTVAYLRSTDGDQVALMAAPLEGDEPRELARFFDPARNSINLGLTFTPDGRHVLYSEGSTFGTTERSPAKLWRVGLAGGEPEPLDLEADHLRTMSLSPDGRGLLFAAGDLVHHEVWTMENVLRQLSRR
jgi:Tol biopolymer transport system component